ncbi:hypothetical protein JYU34_014919 [Plutella xylostella]|uniref:Uncharacterized protein n=1 Tax=Plutella xylostella TaxID=51655 RepID=A0ABQ7Q649_PLUXY|nr:hypothetical protein JYU34_014919 [Plutella xylostella]
MYVIKVLREYEERAITCAAARPQSLPGAEALGGGGPASLSSLTPDHQLREDFTVLAKDLVHSLKGIVGTLVSKYTELFP